MSRAILAAGLVLCAAASARAAPDESVWRQAERSCVAAIEAQYGCTTACNNQLWPLWARCTNERLGNPFPPAALEACMQRIWDRRQATQACELCGGDPVKEALACASR
jgi:hypothetical protein